MARFVSKTEINFLINAVLSIAVLVQHNDIIYTRRLSFQRVGKCHVIKKDNIP